MRRATFAAIAALAVALLASPAPPANARPIAAVAAACQEEGADWDAGDPIAARLRGTWEGSVDWTGHGVYASAWTFTPDGRAVGRNGGRGTWSLSGSTLRVSALDTVNDNRRLEYSGTLSGDTWRGHVVSTGDGVVFEGDFVFSR